MRFGIVVLVLVLMIGFVCGFESEVYHIGVEIPGVEDDSDVVVVNHRGSSGGGGCYEDWSCGNWSECVDGYEERECVDLQKCGTVKNRPEVRRGCGEDDDFGRDIVVGKGDVDKDEIGFVSRVTGAVVGVVGSTGGAVVAGVFVLVVIGGFFAMRIRSRGR